MKKLICLLLALMMLISLAACGGTKPEPAPEAGTEAAPDAEIKDWTREGYFADEDANILSVTWMELDDSSGWFAGYMNGEDLIEDSYSGMLSQEGNALRGTLSSGGSKGDLTVTITEEGEDGLLLTVEGGETRHFTPAEMETAAFGININTEGMGQIACAETEEELNFDDCFTSTGFGLSEPAAYVFGAKTDEEGWHFVKWTKNGEDYSTDPIIPVELTEDADFVAVFEFGEDGQQNPAMNFIGEYASDRAHALVEAEGDNAAKITIEWGGSAFELVRWVMSGPLDLDTLTVDYSNCVKSVVTYGEDGELADESVEYENGTGRIVFGESSTFTWQGDQSDEESLIFEWSWEPAPID